MSMKSLIEQAAMDVGKDVIPSEAGTNPDNFGIDITSIIEVVMGIIQKIMEMCPQSNSNVAAAFKSPTLRQRAALRLQVRDACEFCNPGFRRFADPIYNSLLARGSQLSDEQARDLIAEARGGSVYSII